MKLQAIAWVLILAIAGWAAMVPAAGNPAVASHTTVELDPSPAFVTPGGSTVIGLWVRGLNDTNGLASFDITLEYDPSVIRVEGVDGGDAPFDRDATVSIDDSVGEIKISGAQNGAGVTEDVRVAALNLTGLGATGDSTGLGFTQAGLGDPAGGPIAAATAVDGSVTVADAIVTVDSVLIPLNATAVVPVTIDFSQEGGLAGYNLTINYDPATVVIDQILSGNAPFAGTPIFQNNEAEGFANIVGFHGNRPGPTGKTVVMRLTLKGVAEGESALEVTVKDLVDAAEADSWPGAAVGGLATVVLPSEIPPSVLATVVPGRTPQPRPEPIRANVSPQIGIEIASSGGGVRLNIPSGAAPQQGFVELQEIIVEDAPPPPEGAVLRSAVEINLLDADGNRLFDVLLDKAATIVMSFTGEDLSSAGENAIVVQRYEPVLGRWIQLPTGVDSANLTATSQVDRFSVFGLVIGEESTQPAAEATPVPTSPEVTPAPAPVSAGPAGGADSGGISTILIVVIVVVVVVLIVAVFAIFRFSRRAPGPIGQGDPGGGESSE